MIKKFLTIVLLVCLWNTNLWSELPRYLDFRLVLNTSEAGKKAQSQLKSKLQNGLKEISNEEKILQNEEKQIISQKKIIAQDEYRKKVDELRKKVSKLQKKRNTLLSTISDQRAKARVELLKNLNPIVKKYMIEKNIRMVIDKKELILADENLDITKDIMDNLNKKIKTLKLN
jgi:outer membrane protein